MLWTLKKASAKKSFWEEKLNFTNAKSAYKIMTRSLLMSLFFLTLGGCIFHQQPDNFYKFLLRGLEHEHGYGPSTHMSTSR